MELKLEEGLTHKEEIKVTEELTAKALSSGTMEVYATPAMIALMESVSKDSVKNYIEEGYTTVGIEINVKHIKASAIGSIVKGQCLLERVEGKRLYFKVEAFDEKGKIGEGTHIRYIVNEKEFLDRAYR
ncbi:thioesterase family protein [Clostridium simiarum]